MSEPEKNPFDGEEIALDPAEIDRFGRAIARIAERRYPLESEELTMAANTYGTAFQFLAMRRGSEYAMRLGRAAEARARELASEDVHPTIQHAFHGLHDRVSAENDKLE
ncbi:MAG: hypothetical protein ACR2J8_06945 [Thermomicrobiales bacterium]